MSHKLENLNVSEVSAVDQGANQGAHIFMLKAKGTSQMNPAEIEKSLTDTKAELVKSHGVVASLTADVAKFKGEAETVSKKLEDVTKALEESKSEVAKHAESLVKKDAEIKTLTEKAADAELENEVSKKYPNSAGTVTEKVAMLKSIKAMPDAGVKKSMLDALDVAEKSATAFTQETGAAVAKTETDLTTKENANKAFNDMVAKEQAEKKITKSKAIDNVTKTKEGRAAYNAAK